MPRESRRVFEKTSEFNVPLAALEAFHAQSGPAQLSPPPIFVQVHRDDRTSLTTGELEFTLWFALLPIRWLARHEPLDSEEAGFADVMVQGPLAYWRHEHIFTPRGNNRTALTDRVTLAHHQDIRGLLTRLMFDGLLLRLLFFYRHLRTRYALRAKGQSHG